MPVISATQLKKYQACPRQWGYRYLDRIPEPTSRGAAVGTLCHWVLEYWLDTAQAEAPPKMPDSQVWWDANKDSDEIRQIMAPLFVSEHCPDTGAVSEAEFKLPLPNTQIPLVGKVDWHFLYPDRVLEIGDLKTCKSFYHMLNVLTLQDDLQAKAYAAAALSIPDWDMLRLKWVYVKTTRTRSEGAPMAFPEPRAVNLEVRRDWARQAQEDIYRAAIPLIQHYESGHSAAECSENPGASCHAYGGCHYRDRCPGYQPKETDQMNPTDLNALLDAKIAELSGNASPAVVSAPTPGVLPPADEMPKAQMIAPEDAAERLARLQEELQRLREGEQSAAAPPPAPEPQAEAPAFAAAIGLDNPPAPRKRGRPKGSKNRSASSTPPPAQPQQVAPETVPAWAAATFTPGENPEPAKEVALPPPPKAVTPPPPVESHDNHAPGRTLYVNCGPLRESAPWLTETVAFRRAALEAAKAAGKEYWALADYGQGPALLAHAFEAQIPYLPTAVRIDNSMPECRALKARLIAWAKEVVVSGG